MKSLASVVENYAVLLSLAFGIATLAYAFLVWLALRKKDFVKATIWHHTSGFSIEARNNNRKVRRTGGD
jgi:hypothetical protein